MRDYGSRLIEVERNIMNLMRRMTRITATAPLKVVQNNDMGTSLAIEDTATDNPSPTPAAPTGVREYLASGQSGGHAYDSNTIISWLLNPSPITVWNVNGTQGSFDNGGYTSNSSGYTGAITIPADGLYQISFQLLAQCQILEGSEILPTSNGLLVASLTGLPLEESSGYQPFGYGPIDTVRVPIALAPPPDEFQEYYVGNAVLSTMANLQAGLVITPNAYAILQTANAPIEAAVYLWYGLLCVTAQFSADDGS